MAAPDDLALRDLEAARVWKAGRPAGWLERTPAGVEFRYDEAYLDAGHPAVATTLPLRRDPVLAPGGAVPPFFAGLLPEGRRLTLLRQALKTSLDDELTLLLAVGHDTVGDVQVLPPEADPADAGGSGDAGVPGALAGAVVERWDEVSFAALLEDSAGLAERSQRWDPVGLPGVQDKVSAQVISLPVAQRQARYILKLQPAADFPGLVENEAFFLDAARRSGLAAARAEVVRDRDGHTGLLVTRFDREAFDGWVQALAQEDACQVLGRWPADKYRVSTEEVCAALASPARARPVAARDVFRQVVFAYLSGNGDAHAKNFSVGLRGGEWRVTPSYDQVCTYLYGDPTLALPINGKRGSDVTRRDLLALAGAAGLTERAASSAIDQVAEAMPGWLADLDVLPFDGRRLHKLRRFLSDRRDKLRGG